MGINGDLSSLQWERFTKYDKRLYELMFTWLTMAIMGI